MSIIRYPGISDWCGHARRPPNRRSTPDVRRLAANIFSKRAGVHRVLFTSLWTSMNITDSMELKRIFLLFLVKYFSIEIWLIYQQKTLYQSVFSSDMGHRHLEVRLSTIKNCQLKRKMKHVVTWCNVLATFEYV